MSLSSFDLAASTGIIFKTMGALNVEPYDASFNSSLTFPFTNNSSISGVSAFTMGKASNTANITIGAPGISVAGPITLYGGALSLGANITSTAGGEIALYSDAALEGLSSARSMTTTGAFRYLPQGTSFSSTVTFPITNLSLVNITELQLGKSGNTASITIGSSATIAGPISIYGGYVNINGNLTSSATGDIFIKGIAGTNPSIWVQSGKTITKSGGTGTLTMQGHGRVSNNGSITTSGTGVLNVVFWSDFDNSNNDGGVSQSGTVSTNGGDVWLGGSNSDGGSYTWNGLTVGDGPSIGSTGFNGNAMDISGNITTNGGDFLAWAGSAAGSNIAGIANDGSGDIVSVGSGDIVLITDMVSGTAGAAMYFTQSGGTFTLVPHEGSFRSTFNWNPAVQTYVGSTADDYNLQTGDFNWLGIGELNSITSLTIGYYNGMLSNGTPVEFTNSSNVTFSTATTSAGAFNLYGGAIAMNTSLTTTSATNGNISINGTSISGTGNLAVAAGRNATINVSSTSSYDGIISGSGSAFTKSGSGLLTLSKDHNYSGATTISGGDLQVGSGGSVSQASSGTISNTTGVAVSNGSKLVLSPNENITFTVPVSGDGGVDIKGASGLYRGTALTTTASLIASNVSVLEVLTRITGGTFSGSAGSGNCGAYQKSYNAATNTATLQFQQLVSSITKVVFVTLERINTTDVAIKGTGAAYRSGDYLGQNMATIGGTTALTFPTHYGISQVFMSGKVNFTGALTYTGTTTLSNTTTSATSPTTYSYISKGTQEITDASSSFPSAIVNNGLVILNRTTPLTIAGDMSGTEDILQVGADVTFTGTNTHTGITTIDLNKSLLIGNGSTSGSITGNIINYGSLTFNRSDNSTYPGIISGSGSLTKLGEGSHTLTGLNTYAGATTITAGKLVLERDVPVTSSTGYSGSGTLVIQPASDSFTSAISYPIAGFTISNSIGGLTLGKTSNSANITFTNATQAAGPITAYGGTITLNANLTTTNNGDISLYTDNALSGLTTTARTITAAGSFNYIPRSDFFSAPVTYPITNLNLTSSGLLIGKPSNTADITFANATTVAGPITAYGGTITLNANLTTTNNGAISLYSDNPLGLGAAITLTAAGAFKYIPRTTTFSADVTYPITNLTATSTGLTIGKTTNDKNITVTQDVTGGAGIELYGANVNINSNLKTTSVGAMYLKGITTIAAGKYIESNGAFTHDGNMTFKSNATGTAAFGTLGGTFTTVSGTSTVERYIPAKRAYRFISPSVTTTTSIRDNWQENGGSTASLGTHITGLNGSANGFDSTTTNNPSLYTINHATGAWTAVANTNVNTLSAGTAYRLMVRGDRLTDLTTNTPAATVTTLRATGVLKTGDYSPTLNQASEGYSFVGNPYQAPVDIKAVLAASTNMNSGVVYYWDPTLNDRGAYVTRDLTSNNNSVTSNFNQYLQPGQAVFVKKVLTSNAASMLFTEDNKSLANSATGVFRTTATENFGTIRTNLRASIDNQWTTIEGALAVFNPMYSWEVNQDDANKFSNLDEEVSFMQNNTSLAIACQSNPSATNELPIRLNTTRRTNYQWQFELGNYSGPTPYLFDTQNNTYSPIENNTIVPFTVNGQELTRFKIVFQNGTLSTPDFSNQIVLYPNPGASGASSFNIEGITDAEVSLYTLLGQKIPVRSATNGKGMEVISKTSLSKGVYLVGITKDGKTSHVKWIVE